MPNIALDTMDEIVLELILSFKIQEKTTIQTFFEGIMDTCCRGDMDFFLIPQATQGTAKIMHLYFYIMITPS